MVCRLDFDLLLWWCACGIKTRKPHARIYRSMSRGHVEYGGYAIRPFIDSCQNVQTKGDVGHLASLPVGGQTSCGQEFTSECQLINGLYAAGNFTPSVLLCTLSSWSMMVNGPFSSHTVAYFIGFWIAQAEIVLLHNFWIGFKQCRGLCARVAGIRPRNSFYET